MSHCPIDFMVVAVFCFISGSFLDSLILSQIFPSTERSWFFVFVFEKLRLFIRTESCMANGKFLGALLILWLLTFPRPVHAYVDPGTGSYFIQLVVGGFLGLLYMLKVYWNRIRNFVASKVQCMRKP